MPIRVDGALPRAPCPVPSCPAFEPKSGSVHPNLPAKAARVERGRHCYAIKWVPVRTCPVIRLIGSWAHCNPIIARSHDLAVVWGEMPVESRMTKRIAKRLLAVVVVLAVAMLATHAVSHWHSHEYDEDHCQICHVGHAAIPQAAAQVAVQAPVPTVRLALAEEFTPELDFVGTLSIPRAPPA
jgi:hypothetical protein